MQVSSETASYKTGLTVQKHICFYFDNHLHNRNTFSFLEEKLYAQNLMWNVAKPTREAWGSEQQLAFEVSSSITWKK
mgnify:CR=1 FL=1